MEAEAEVDAALLEAAEAEAAVLVEAAALVLVEAAEVSVVLLAQATRQRTIATARSRAISFFIVCFSSIKFFIQISRPGAEYRFVRRV